MNGRSGRSAAQSVGTGVQFRGKEHATLTHSVPSRGCILLVLVLLGALDTTVAVLLLVLASTTYYYCYYGC
jgi:hypothetical protein